VLLPTVAESSLEMADIKRVSYNCWLKWCRMVVQTECTVISELQTSW
jgi:hypothetical protein